MSAETTGQVTHREEEYDSGWFEILLDMQARHFWYAGRHRFLLRAVRNQLKRAGGGEVKKGLRAIDLGGGCGGWVRYLNQRTGGAGGMFSELVLSVEG